MSSFPFPQELWEHVLDLVAGESTDSKRDLRACALVNTAWTQRSQERLFQAITLVDNTQRCRLHTLLRATAPHLRRFVHELELRWLRLTASTGDTGALDWTGLLPLVTRISFMRSAPDLGFMTQLPSLRHVHVALYMGHGLKAADFASLKAAAQSLPSNTGEEEQLPHRLLRVTFDGDRAETVQPFVLRWVASTATSRARSLRRADLVVGSIQGPTTYLQEFLDDNGGITDLGLFITYEPGFARIDACVLRLAVFADRTGLRMMLDFLRTAAFPALRELELSFLRSLGSHLYDDYQYYFEPFGDTGGTDDEDCTTLAVLAAQVREVTVTLDSIAILFHSRRFLDLFREVDRLGKLRLRHNTDLEKVEAAYGEWAMDQDWSD